MTTRPLQKHLLIELHTDSPLLDNLPFWEETLPALAYAAGSTIIGRLFHKFNPQGLSGVLLLAESHLSIHTWPECGLATFDFYTCGQNVFPEKGLEVLNFYFPEALVKAKILPEDYLE